MELLCIGSGSSGNCYILRSRNECLVVEMGIKDSALKKALDFDLASVCGCVISHRHNDHSASVKKVTKWGVPILALEDVFEAHGIAENPFCIKAQPHKGYKIGEYKIYCLPVEHDVQCLAFVIEHAECGKVLFVTDTMFLPYKVKGVRHIMIEANYADDILQENINAGKLPFSHRERLMCTHMELETTKKTLRENDLSNVQEIVLLHLSNDNSDEERFVREVRELTGIPTYAAKSGLTLELK